jgi:hypothetical protein
MSDQNAGGGGTSHAAWGVERVHPWFNGSRAILVRRQRRADLYLATIKVASILLWYGHLHRPSFLR